ncbi:4Fe-4S dicluster domain-containing protein [Chloroflexota bacterium]
MVRNRELSIAPEHCSGCLRCALACSFFTTRQRSFNPSQSKIQVTVGPEDGQFEVRLTEDCNHCGICIQYCEFGVLN